ncbi:Amidase [Serinicoccus hydrothermalis]|uniref:Amidase n=1 Tax=Serinicoccus hydrothermalis TaxID=1758689 RepID=A0A1B1N8T5_9MICO|nr:amidase [Serinicoccus hydrothermalis]ANS77795.1 Amidase [Serinicoccus hydrothermalis]
MSTLRPTVCELSAAYADGSTTPLEATERALEAIERLDPLVHAMVLVDREGALEAARASTRRWADGAALGPADGIPTTIKDILLTRGWPTLRGSLLIEEGGPQDWPEDAPAVARLRAAGCVLLGKNSTPEFAWKGVTDSLRHGHTGNPWDPTLTSGGSSGGAAAAVALGMGAWSVGTDGGGSVRIPASFTGTVALKPTYGRIPLFPASPYGTLSHAGPITTCVDDAALMLDLVGRPDPRDWSALPEPPASFWEGLEDGVEGLRVAVSPRLGLDVDNDPEVEEAVLAAAQQLAEDGAQVEQVDPGISDPVDAFHVLWFSGAAKVIEAYGPGALDRVDPGLREAVLRHGEGASASAYLDATAVRMELGRRMGIFHETYDVLLTPTMPIPAFELGHQAPGGGEALWTSWTPYTYPFNMTQQPALSVPCGLTAQGRPIGLQVVGARHDDARVLRVGRAVERRAPAGLPPMLSDPAPEGRGERA